MKKLLAYYDRSGQPVSLEEWARSLDDMEKRRVVETTLPDGTWISTVWLGLDHGFEDGPPLIFETMVFPNKTGLDGQECKRYPTEAEALAGHEAMVAKWSGPIP